MRMYSYFGRINKIRNRNNEEVPKNKEAPKFVSVIISFPGLPENRFRSVEDVVGDQLMVYGDNVMKNDGHGTLSVSKVEVNDLEELKKNLAGMEIEFEIKKCEPIIETKSE